jgi:DHA2 family multidrug resistance protein
MITVTKMLATLMQALDTMIANVALPYMQGSRSATSEEINWVLTSYIVAAAIITPATGWLEARFGRETPFLTSVIGFMVTSMLCGAAVSLTQIVVFRPAAGRLRRAARTALAIRAAGRLSCRGTGQGRCSGLA